MKHAVLILAHTNFPLLEHLVDYFSIDCDVFIHLDKEFKLTRQQFDSLSQKTNVIQIFKTYKIKWGDVNILKAELSLLATAYDNSNAEYFHLISGEDYPIKPLKYFLDFFKTKYPQNFISTRPLLYFEAYFRLMTFSPFGLINGKTTKGKLKLDVIQDTLIKYKIMRNTASMPMFLYVGSQWFSITRNAVQTILKYTERNKRFLNRLRWTFAADEIFIQTALNEKLPSEQISNDNLRFIQWKDENSASPLYLDTTKFKDLAASQALFARKIKTASDCSLIPAIDRFLLNQSLWERCFCFHNYNCNVAEIISLCCKAQGITTILDVKCGTGLYVAAIIGKGININGLGQDEFIDLYKLLGINDLVIIANITDDLTVQENDRYDALLCSDDILFSTYKKESNIIKNFSKLVSRYLFVVCKENSQIGNDLCIIEDQPDFTANFHLDKGVSNILNHECSLRKEKVKIYFFNKIS